MVNAFSLRWVSSSSASVFVGFLSVPAPPFEPFCPSAFIVRSYPPNTVLGRLRRFCFASAMFSGDISGGVVVFCEVECVTGLPRALRF